MHPTVLTALVPAIAIAGNVGGSIHPVFVGPLILSQ
jgi:hypothetical protein